MEESIRRSCRSILNTHLAPRIEECEERFTFCQEAQLELGKAGLVAPLLPEDCGGAADPKAQLIVAEEMGYFCAGFGLSSLASSVLFGANVARLGTREQKNAFLPGIISGEKMGCWALTEPEVGSDALSIKTRCQGVTGGFKVSGSKTFITNAPVADYFLVMARGEGSGIEGGFAFIMERGQEGLKTGTPFKKMGHLSSPTGEIFLEDVFVPTDRVLGQPGKAFYDMKHSLDVERIIFSGLAVGMMRFCLEKSLAYSKERKQFGRSISDFQMIQDKIARMTVAFESAKAYLYRTTDKMVEGQDVNREAAITKLLVSESLKLVADEAVQIHGGYGYVREYQVERVLRDSKLFEIGAGTSEVQKMIVAKQALKESGWL